MFLLSFETLGSSPVICSIHKHVPLLYAGLTVLALVSPYVPWLRELSAHGKTRIRPRDGWRKTTGGSLTKEGSSHTTVKDWVLHGELFMVRKRCFTHFYVLGLLALGYLSYTSLTSQTKITRIQESLAKPEIDLAVLLIAIHLVRRLAECLLLHRWRNTSVMHVAGYLLGMVHYAFLPFVILDLGCKHEGDDSRADLPDASSRHANYVMLRLAVAAFGLWAQYQQYRHHTLLAELRSPHNHTVDGSEHTRSPYRLPTGGWFGVITCPHYTAEVMIYGALALLLNQRHGWNLFLWVLVNLTVSARQSHRWYQTHCVGFAATHRYAILPFVS
jgi:3-oxo-5-alpha-steroid 4-dehydrogenase 3